jgi:hypothetical protein
MEKFVTVNDDGLFPVLWAGGSAKRAGEPWFPANFFIGLVASAEILYKYIFYIYTMSFSTVSSLAATSTKLLNPNLITDPYFLNGTNVTATTNASVGNISTQITGTTPFVPGSVYTTYSYVYYNSMFGMYDWGALLYYPPTTNWSQLNTDKVTNNVSTGVTALNNNISTSIQPYNNYMTISSRSQYNYNNGYLIAASQSITLTPGVYLLSYYILNRARSARTFLPHNQFRITIGSTIISSFDLPNYIKDPGFTSVSTGASTEDNYYSLSTSTGVFWETYGNGYMNNGSTLFANNLNPISNIPNMQNAYYPFKTYYTIQCAATTIPYIRQYLTLQPGTYSLYFFAILRNFFAGNKVNFHVTFGSNIIVNSYQFNNWATLTWLNFSVDTGLVSSFTLTSTTSAYLTFTMNGTPSGTDMCVSISSPFLFGGNWNLINNKLAIGSTTSGTLSLSMYNPSTNSIYQDVGYSIASPNIVKIGEYLPTPTYVNGLMYAVFNTFHGNVATYSSTATLRTVTQSSTATGTGLLNIGTAYNLYNTDQATNYFVRYWGSSAASSLENFSVEWTGYFLPNATGTWTFYNTSDDECYIWLGTNAHYGYTTSGNYNLTNNYSGNTKSFSISLTSGVYYPLRILYGDGVAGDVFRFSFSNPSGTTFYDGTGFYFTKTSMGIGAPLPSTPLFQLDSNISVSSTSLAVSNWATTNGSYSATQGTTANQPRLQSFYINGLPGIHFGGVSGKILTIGSLSGVVSTTTLTLFFVVHSYTLAKSYNQLWGDTTWTAGALHVVFTSDRQLLLGVNSTNVNNYTAIYSPLNTPIIVMVNLTSSSGNCLSYGRINGVQGSTFQHQAGSLSLFPSAGTSINIGNWAGDTARTLDGGFGEIICYTRNLTGTEITTIEQYLSVKYAIPPVITYLSSTNTSVSFWFSQGPGRVTSYVPYINGSATTGSGSVSTSTTTNTYTISGLTQGTAYSVQMGSNSYELGLTLSPVVTMSTSSPATIVSATGSYTTATVGSYTVYQFSGNGTISINNAKSVFFAIIGGGASGGAPNYNGNASAGGGSGGGVYYNSTNGTAFSAGATYTVTVGQGGTGVTNSTSTWGPYGNAGGTTSIFGTGVGISVAGGNGGGSTTGPNQNSYGFAGGGPVTSGSGGGTGAVQLTSGTGGNGSQGTLTYAGVGPSLVIAAAGINATYVSSGGGGGRGGGFNTPGYPGAQSSTGATQYTSSQLINGVAATWYGCGGGGGIGDGRASAGKYSGAGAPGRVWLWFLT